MEVVRFSPPYLTLKLLRRVGGLLLCYTLFIHNPHMISKLPKINITEEELKTTYKETLVMMWYVKASDLLKASKVLENNCIFFNTVKNKLDNTQDTANLSSVILMLRGMSVECLLKRLLTKQGKIEVVNGSMIIPDKYLKHNLKTMAQDISELNLDINECITLECLSKYIELARLPPKSALSGSQVLIWTLNNHEEAFDKILRKIYLL